MNEIAKRSAGRPSKFTTELAENILNWIAGGETIGAACRKAGISKPTLYDWMDQHLDFGEAFIRARRMGAHSYSDKVAEVGEEARAGKISPSAAQAAISAFKWMAEKQDPGTYGNKADGGKIQIVIESSLFSEKAAVAGSKGELVLEARLAPPDPDDNAPGPNIRRRSLVP